MAGGSEIKSVLNLDVTKFTSAIDKATSNLETLDGNLKSAGKVAAAFDKNVGELGANLGGVADKFRLLDQTIGSMVSKLVGVVRDFDKIGRSTTDAAQGVERLGSAVKKASSINADRWVRKYSDELDKLAPAIKTAVSSILDLDRANIASSAVAEKTAKQTAAAKLKSLEAEREGNSKIIAEREKMASELATIQSLMEKRADANGAIARNFFGKNFSKGAQYREEAAAAQAAASAAAQEVAAIGSVISELKWKNGEIAKSIDLIRQEEAAVALREKTEREAIAATEQAKREAKRVAKQEAAEKVAAEKQAAREAREAVKTAKEAEKQVAREAAAEAKEQKRAEAAAAKEAARQAKQAAKEAREIEKKAAREAAAEAVEQKRIAAESAKVAEKVAREASRAAKEAEKEAAREAAAEVREQKRKAAEEAKEFARQAREAAKAEKEAAKQASREAAVAEKEARRIEKEEAREAERVIKESAREKAKAEKDAAREKAAAERQAAREAAQAAREAEREQKKSAKEVERAAKEAAREKARAEKEAAKAAADSARETAAVARQLAADQARAAREAAAARIAAAREAAAEEKRQAQEVAAMWKSMGQLWAASKIERGLGAGLGKASEYQQAEMRVKLMNLPTDEFEEFKAKAFDISKEEKYISVIDTMQARLDALTAIGYNNKGTIDATMQSAIRNSQLLMSSGYEGGSRSDLIKNLYGFAESRQVMYDPEKVKESFDIARRMAIVSGGKLNVADLETVARNMGDLRQSMNMEGWLGVASLMEQFKVAGSQGHGGAGAGVSSVGTMLKMMSLYAAGKPVTNTAAVQLLGADVLNDTFSEGAVGKDAKANGEFARMVKTAGFKNAKDMQADPVSFFSGLRGQVLDYTKLKDNKAKFYDSDDTDSKEAESTALKRFLSKMGMSNKTVDGLLLMMDKGFIERAGHVKESAKKLEDEDKAIAKMKETWKTAVDEMNAGAANLAVAFAPLLEPLSKIPRAIGQILNKAAEFVKDNPLMAGIDLAVVAAGGLMLALKGTVGVLGSVGGALNPVKVLMGGFSTSIASASGFMASLRAGVLAASMAFPGLATAMDTIMAIGSKLLGPLLAPFSAVAGGATGALGWLARLSAGLLGFVAKWASPVGWLVLAGQFGYVIGQWVADLKVGGISIGEHMQNIFLDIEVGWKSMLLKVQEKWIEFKKLIGGDDYLAESAERKELDAERARLAAYDKMMRIVPTDPPKPAPPPKKDDKDGHDKDGHDKDGKKTGSPNVRNVADPFAKPDRPDRQFENSFQRSLEQMVGREKIDRLKLDTILTGDESYAAQAKAMFAEKWLGGDFDDGKDPSKRKFVKGGKKYNEDKGWSADDIDWSGMDEQTKKTVQNWLDAYAASKKLEDGIKGITFASERAAAKEDEAGTAIGRMTGDILGQTDAMKALNREFAREEARNPTVKGDKSYQDKKQTAITKQAIADYANMGADLVQKNKEMEASFLDTERERIRASADAVYESKRQEAQLVKSQLDKQIRDMEAAGKQGTQDYNDAVAARAAGEAEFTRFLKNIQEERTRALLTPTQRLMKEWNDVYSQLENLQAQWANGFADTFAQLITTGKADFRSLIVSMLADLSKVMLKKGMVGMMDQLTGKAGIVGVGQAAINGGGVAAGGLLGDWVNKRNGYAMRGDGMMGPPAPLGLGAGAGAEQAAKGASDAMQGAADAANASAVATTAATAAKEAETAAVTTSTTVTAADAAAVEASTVATVIDTGVTEAKTVADAVDMGVTEAGTAANIANTASEWAEVTANEVSAATEYLANGGVATPSGLSFFANGGAFTNSVVDSPTLFKFANGGKFGVMGEAGPEAVMPLSRDGKGRLGVTVNGGAGASGDAAPIVNIAITVNNDGSSRVSASGDQASDWRKMADRVKGVVREELATQQRPGGILYK